MARPAKRTPSTSAPDVEGVADAPVYDDRGNVRPRGTEGARPMTYEERVAVAEKIRAEDS